jgi:hypothetical protein
MSENGDEAYEIVRPKIREMVILWREASFGVAEGIPEVGMVKTESLISARNGMLAIVYRFTADVESGIAASGQKIQKRYGQTSAPATDVEDAMLRLQPGSYELIQKIPAHQAEKRGIRLTYPRP